MSSRRRERRKACEGKRRFASEKEATSRQATNQKSYKCNHCGNWHLAHRLSTFNQSIGASMMKRRGTLFDDEEREFEE